MMVVQMGVSILIMIVVKLIFMHLSSFGPQIKRMIVKVLNKIHKSVMYILAFKCTITDAGQLLTDSETEELTMRLFGKLIGAAITAAMAAGAVYILKKRAEEDAYDLDEFDEDFDEDENFEDAEAEEAAADEEPEIVKAEAPEEEKVVLENDVEVADLDGDGKADAVYVDLNSDGKIDALAVDTDDDGKADKILIDTDGDGVSDTVVSTEEKTKE